MNNREKIINAIEKAKKQSEEYAQEYILVPFKEADMIIALLKEQEPLEPSSEEIEQAGPLYHRCYCKKCGHHVGNMIKNKVTEVHENFCSSCGQAVKWDE